MEEGKENISYSAEYILKYLEGQLSDREMQSLEKAALEDPFLADAIEGLAESRRQSVSFESNISDLQKRLADRIRQRDRKKGIVYLLSNWQVAASVLFVIGTAVLTYTFISNRTGQTNIAKTIKKDSGAEKQNAGVQDMVLDSIASAQRNSQPSVPPVESTAVALAEPPAIEKKSRKNKAYEPEGVVSNDKVSKSRAIIVLPDSISAKKDISVAANDPALLTRAAAPVAPLLQRKAAGVSISKNRTYHYIQGIVLNDSNKPIPFARVNLSGSKKGTSADENGYFKMYLDKARDPREIIINSLGYQPVSTEFNTDSALVQKFQMQTSASSLNEVVVTGYGTENGVESDLASSKKEAYQIPLPTGWDSLLSYINTNKKITTADSLLKGEEVISFTVNKKGEPFSFKVVKSISSVHDAEIIRLIKSGPLLKPQKGKKQICEIAVLFK